jgi:hypothetical protein
MGYRRIKRALGETNLERKRRVQNMAASQPFDRPCSKQLAAGTTDFTAGRR